MITYFRWQDILDILVVAFIVYKTFLLIKGTRAIQLIVGFIIVLFVFYLAKTLELFTLSWIFNSFVGSIILVIVVIFQSDIRRVLVALGRSPFFKKITYVQETLFYDELTNACTVMGKRRNGALIVIEREVGLEEFMEIGIRLDAEMNTELIVSIFQNASPLHDGAMIVREGRIRAAGCVLPLTTDENLDKSLGTRHRAAIGITEVTDAFAVVVSEEHGTISYALKGEFFAKVNADVLKKALKEVLA
ncbi:MAG: DNA integrity scanning protein DisA [Syntrophorhabdus sp. PtaU1.Bin058]|nr:MAG: DNA integrity scanning protein DisA [Syntrophorhabdus sp. PtaU1.Bin058]